MDIENNLNQPICVIVIGMAGSGKTTFLQQFYNQIINREKFNKSPYFINLDPGVLYLPYTAQVDIRTSIDYKELMKKNGLGPNGAIMAALNIYSAKFYEVLQEIESNKKESSFFCVDTPGQIEVFAWSASGSIITNAVAQTIPTAIIYIMDSTKCHNPNTFMSNMLFCCSILYKSKLPLIVVFNKCDVQNSDTLVGWINDYQKFMDAAHQDESYLATLSYSLCLSLEEFYKDLNYVSVSSINGFGFDNLFDAIEKAKKEYFDVFLTDLKSKMTEKQTEMDKKKVEEELKKFGNDFENLNVEEEKKQNIAGVFDQSKGKKIHIIPSAAQDQNKK